MKTKLAKETLLNQTKTDLINELLIKTDNKTLNSIVCSGACGSGVGGGGY